MPIECMPSNLSSDIRCAVCGQGFLVFARHTAHERFDHVRVLVQRTLRQHHDQSTHPAGPFMVDCTPEPLAAFA